MPDAPGAGLLVAVGIDDDGDPVAVAVDPGRRRGHDRAGDPLRRHPLAGPRDVRGARGRRLEVDADVLADAWYLAHALIAAESIGAAQTCLDVSVEYAKERFTFGRAIGSYQAIKHELTEVLRRLENCTRPAVLRRLGAGVGAGGVPARGERGALGGRWRARLRGALDDQRARRHRRHVGARRAVVLPPGAALAATARRHPRRDRSRRRADDERRRDGVAPGLWNPCESRFTELRLAPVNQDSLSYAWHL